VPTAKVILNEVERRLHDPDNKIWPRAELFDSLNEGQRDFAAKTEALATIQAIDTPGRWYSAVGEVWELQTLRPNRSWLPFWVARGEFSGRATYRWEIEQIDGASPTNSGDCITQPWELSHRATDRILPLMLPSNHLRTRRATWNDKRLGVTSVKDLDDIRFDWWAETGLPQWMFHSPLGTKQFGIFPLSDNYLQGYILEQGDEPGSSYWLGGPRFWSGDRTYSFTVNRHTRVLKHGSGYTSDGDIEHAPDLGYHFTRNATSSGGNSLFSETSWATHAWEEELLEDSTQAASTETKSTNYAGTSSFESVDGFVANNFPNFFVLGTPRDYRGRDYNVNGSGYGVPRYLSSSDSGLALYFSHFPDALEGEADIPREIPTQLHKYLRAYVLAKAFEREGPGFNPDLAMFYWDRYNLGVKIFKKMANPTIRDLVMQRKQRQPITRRPPRVQLPPEFPRVV